MNDVEIGTMRLLKTALAARRDFAVADQTAKPTYPAYLHAKAINRQKIRQLIRDIRWARKPIAA